MLATALADMPASDSIAATRWSGQVLVGLGLWAFALHRHLLRRLLAFNIIGTGIFLVLMTLVGEAATAAGHGLVMTGLMVALLGTVLGALLIRRLDTLDAQRVVGSESGGGAP
ncbi:Na+/H+ antiporter subunit C [Billgrantia endophytica]|uniref:Na+/H+ antiporter subunit C n=2 Tax=Billgrantia endophytica TaxID=2033802 RepID=A0A2N7UBX7_9GAMM|nr:Na+/H+ antiporter subunit C [Halomonas endophytica]